jgi:hypothetical protein
MSAVTEIEKLLKESQKECESFSEEKKEALREEEEELRQDAERAVEEAKQRNIERQRKVEERKRQEEELKASGLQKTIEESKELLLEAKKKLEEELEEEISQAKEDEKKRCYEEMESQISQAAESFDKDIAKARRDLEKAKSVAQKVEAKAASVESDYKSLLESEEADDGKKQKDSVLGGPSITTDLVASITAENKRRAAEAQIMSLSMVCDDLQPEMEAYSATQELLESSTDPKHNKTFEEWSIMTKQVTGLTDALYTEPSESPYFQQNERTHALIGPTVKEYVRDKQTRLLDHWTLLAEEYEVRKRLYEKQQKKLARKGNQRGSISIAGRKSILGNKESSQRTGLERGGNILESTARSNNPYRRARRGNEVRSEYEQEQIIAEIAAKEAMEKRITHGGSKLPRQICRLERVSCIHCSSYIVYGPSSHYGELSLIPTTGFDSLLYQYFYFTQGRRSFPRS